MSSCFECVHVVLSSKIGKLYSGPRRPSPSSSHATSTPHHEYDRHSMPPEQVQTIRERAQTLPMLTAESLHRRNEINEKIKLVKSPLTTQSKSSQQHYVQLANHARGQHNTSSHSVNDNDNDRDTDTLIRNTEQNPFSIDSEDNDIIGEDDDGIGSVENNLHVDSRSASSGAPDITPTNHNISNHSNQIQNINQNPTLSDSTHTHADSLTPVHETMQIEISNSSLHASLLHTHANDENIDHSNIDDNDTGNDIKPIRKVSLVARPIPTSIVSPHSTTSPNT